MRKNRISTVSLLSREDFFPDTSEMSPGDIPRILTVDDPIDYTGSNDEKFADDEDGHPPLDKLFR